ncbi:alternative ribosome rescue aminoacyl-tRNA hydrolase ArfB [Thiosocius teredinicola]|uniref:alternative ribosome rescue aminoacyl-tRNA hydrolase ArfB n=1 Tax=Thiosocius teredinicola TaxID=1973002 RepID=UPI0038CD80BC
MTVQIAPGIELNDDALQWQAIRAQGAGGQNVNKVSSALHLRVDINNSGLPEAVCQRLLQLGDSRITSDGIIVIKAQRFRTQEKNRADALERLRDLIVAAGKTQKARRATKPTKASQRRRMDSKAKHGQLKRLRRNVDD